MEASVEELLEAPLVAVLSVPVRVETKSAVTKMSVRVHFFISFTHLTQLVSLRIKAFLSRFLDTNFLYL